MNENEIIIVDGIPAQEYDAIFSRCINYSIISLPFTVDRMRIPNEVQRSLNIAKGKIAESLFMHFCSANDIHPDFDTCTTPFWTIDNRDFILDGEEWDIKNNFIYHRNDILSDFNYCDLPALVPNRYAGDQWSKRDQRMINGSKGIRFLFTFLKDADLVNGRRGNEFLEIVLSQQQQSYLRSLYSKYNGNPQKQPPFAESWFWEEMTKRGNQKLFRLNFRPCLIIAAYISSAHWSMFRDTGPFDRNNNFQDHLTTRWYTKIATGSLNFMNGTLWTKITNATCPIRYLPSFLSIYPRLRTKINCAYIKNNGD